MEYPVWKDDFKSLEKLKAFIQEKVNDIQDQTELKRIYETYLDLLMYMMQQDELRKHRNHDKPNKLLN